MNRKTQGQTHLPLPVESMDALWQLQQAITLLANLNNTVSDEMGIDCDQTAAVAAYVRDSLEQVLDSVTDADDAVSSGGIDPARALRGRRKRAAVSAAECV